MCVSVLSGVCERIQGVHSSILRRKKEGEIKKVRKSISHTHTHTMTTIQTTTTVSAQFPIITDKNAKCE